MKTLLVHTCCGPCFVFPYGVLKDKYNITSYFYNPNIHPSMEYIRRLDTLADFCKSNNIDLKVGEYDPWVYFKEVAVNRSDRCRMCYIIRLKEAASYAAEKGYDAFTSTLLVSAYQKHELIREIGAEFAKAYDVEFRYWDFRDGFRSGQDRAKELEMYRQPYCGCMFSEMERYDKKLKRAVKRAGDR